MAVHRLPRPPRADGEAISATPRITRDGTGGAVVRLRHHAPAARAVALLANGWWRPEPRDACDLEPIGDGWWEASFAVPDTWRATYGFLEHHGEGDPPWWEHGLKGSAARTATAAGAAAGHGASRVAGMRSVLAVPADGPFATPAPGTPDPPSAPLRLPGAGDVPIRAWASLPGDPGGGAPDVGGPDPAAPLPLLVLTDAAFHLGPDDGPGGLGTLARLRAGVTAGLLPPLACVLLGSAGRRDEELGVPGGHAPLIAERLLPHLDAHGLPRPDGTVARIDPDPARTVVAGSSYGGLTALFSLARAPQRIGAAIAQSPSLWRFPAGSLVGPLAAAASGGPARLRLQAGSVEGDAGGGVTALAAELTAGGVDAQARVMPGGHDWAWWVPEMLHELAALLR